MEPISCLFWTACFRWHTPGQGGQLAAVAGAVARSTNGTIAGNERAPASETYDEVQLLPPRAR